MIADENRKKNVDDKTIVIHSFYILLYELLIKPNHCERRFIYFCGCKCENRHHWLQKGHLCHILVPY